MSTRWVWVLRHAQAAEGDVDRERPLTGRGRRQAVQLRARLRDGDDVGAPLPGTVLCSSARRARETAERVLAEERAAEVQLEPGLYRADADDVLRRLAEVPDDEVSVMVVGHNPALHEAVQLLLGEGESSGRERVERFPTCALAVVAVVADSWSRLAPGTGTLVELWTPSR